MISKEDPYRPLCHFTPTLGWMNDPNGLIYHQGEYHLFYQYVPPGGEGLHWGHAVSRDLLCWEHLPIALFPDALGSIWSGSIVADVANTSGLFAGGGGGLVAIFTHQRPGSQCQSLAYSSDRGRSWTKFAGNPVLVSSAPNFRDPKVFWYSRGGHWMMVLAAGGEMHFYASPDLKNWTFRSAFGGGRFASEDVWECPDLFCPPFIGGQRNDGRIWVLSASIVSPRDPETRAKPCAMRHFIGRFDGKCFDPHDSPNQGFLTDHGPDNYAAMTWTDAPDGRCVTIGWMNNWMYASDAPTHGWQGAMTLPRELSLELDATGSFRLRQSPVREWPLMRAGIQGWSDRCLPIGEEHTEGWAQEVFELDVEMVPGNARECGLLLCKGVGAWTTLSYNPERGVLFLDRTKSGKVDFHPGFPSRHEVSCRPCDGKVRLRIIVDRCSVEVFADNGKAVLTALIFPGSPRENAEFYTIGGDAFLERMDIHRLAPPMNLARQ